MSAVCPGLTGLSPCRMAGCASARACATPTSPMTRPSASASRRSPKRCSRAPPPSCAMPRPSAATCCNARAAPISTSRREVALEEFHLLPGATPERESVLAPGELVLAVRLPSSAARFAAHARYLKLRERTSYAFAVVSAAACLHIEDGVIAEARLALGGVAAKPWRARAAEAALAGVRPNSEHFRRAAEAALAEARPSGDNAFKIELARRIAVRTLALAAAGTPERLPALPGSPFAPIPGGALHG